MRFYRILARLLDYPDTELEEHLDDLDAALLEEGDVSEQERAEVRRVIAWMRGLNLVELQAEYVRTFDLNPDHALHLTHHLFGEDRERGPAMVDLGEHYKGMGLAAKDTELPDYLPLILEYVSTLDATQAHFFLADAAKVTTPIAERLEAGESPYAPLLRIVAQHGSLARAAA